MTVITAATVNTVTTIIVNVTITTVVTVMKIAAMEMGNIPQKPALSVVTSIDVSIGTEIISDSESHAYSADHPGHSKFNNSFTMKKHDIERIYRNKIVNCRGRGGHPPETLTALSYHTFGIYGHCHGQLTALYLLTALDETAPETSVLKIPSSEAIQNHSTGAENGIGLSGSKDHRGRSRGRGDIVRVRYIFGKREFCEGSASDRSPNR